jgi:ABC-type phosphate transport system permease subunit
MKNQNSGFIYKIVLVIVALVLLKYFLNFDVIEFFRSPSFQNFFGPIWQNVKNVWSAVLPFLGKN